MNNKTLHLIAFALTIIGGLNWLLVGLFGWGIGTVTDQVSPTLTQVIYILVGVSAAYLLVTHKATCRECSAHGPIPSI